MDSQSLVLFPLWYAAFLLSLTCHEAAHAWVARLGGDDTAYEAGQVSLNPWPHLRREPVGTIVVPLMTYFLFSSSVHWMMGWASAPYSPDWELRHPRRAAAMSIAGPAANFLLFGLAFAALKLGLGSGAWVEPDQLLLDQLVKPAAGTFPALEGIGRFLSVVFCLNLILWLFNLIPVPPLDGAGVVSGFSAPLRGFYARIRAMPVMSVVGILLAWKLAPIIVSPALGLAVAFLHGG